MPEYKTGSDFDPDQNKNQAENTLEQPKTPDKSLTETQDPEAMMTEPMKEVFGAIKDFYHKYEHLASDEAIDELNDDFERFARMLESGRSFSACQREQEQGAELSSSIKEEAKKFREKADGLWEKADSIRDNLNMVFSTIKSARNKSLSNSAEHTFLLRTGDMLAQHTFLLFVPSSYDKEKNGAISESIDPELLAEQSGLELDQELSRESFYDFEEGNYYETRIANYFQTKVKAIYFIRNLSNYINKVPEIIRNGGDPGFNYTNYQEAWNDRPDLNNISPEEREAFEQKIKSVMLPWERKIAWIKQSSDYEEMRKNYEKAKAEGDIS